MAWLSKTKGVYIVGAKRTGFGAFGGTFKEESATELAIQSAKAVLEQTGVNPEWISASIFGNVLGLNEPYLARHVGLAVGLHPDKSTALTINRLCGSGFETILQGAQHLHLTNSDLVLCGGTESMSRAPYTLQGNVRFGIPLGSKSPQLKDSLWNGLTDPFIQTPMGVTAENIAKQYNITREECDEYAIMSQQRHATAADSGKFLPELVHPDHVDEHARPNSTYEKIAKLPSVFQKSNGVVTAANASGIADGAGTLLLASHDALTKYNLTPMAKIESYHVSGCHPETMGLGPITAVQGALQQANNLDLKDVDIVEINEAFAAQVLACQRTLEVPMEKMNVCGGAIAMGHPLAASGSRIMAHLAHQLQQQQQQYAMGSACIGGGQGIAILLSQP